MPAGAGPSGAFGPVDPQLHTPGGGDPPLAQKIKSFQFLVLPVESGAPCLGRLPGPQTQPSMQMKLRAQTRSILSKSWVPAPVAHTNPGDILRQRSTCLSRR